MHAKTDKELHVVTHGDKFLGADPGMTEKGFREIKSLSPYIPAKPTYVVCGTGKRHICVSEALGLEPNEYCCLVGDGDSGEMINGELQIILPGGNLLPFEKHTSLNALAPAILPFLMNLPTNTVICSGKPLGIVLRFAKLYAGDFVSTAVYKISIYNDHIPNGPTVIIKKVFAIGDIDPALVG